MRLKLSYLDPSNQQPQEITVNTPVAIGSDLDRLPTQIKSQNVAPVLVSNASISPYHALVDERQGKIIVIDTASDRPIGVSKNRFTVGKVKFSFEILPESVIGGGSFNTNRQAGDRCQKMVGFLFKRRCDRTSPIDCPHCNDAGEDLNDYESDYVYYENYGNYDTWGYIYYRDRHYYHYDYNNRRVEFTEADNAAFESEGDYDFERDYSAS